MSERRKEVLRFEVAIEDDRASFGRTRMWVIERMLRSLRGINHGWAVIGVYNEADEVETMATAGKISDEAQDLIDNIFEQQPQVSSDRMPKAG